MITLTERQAAAVTLASELGIVKNGDIKRLYPHVCAEAIRQDLRRLCAAGLLVKQGQWNATTYTLPELIRVPDARTRAVLRVANLGRGQLAALGYWLDTQLG